MKKTFFLFLTLLSPVLLAAQTDQQQKEVMLVVDQFMTAIDEKDTAAFNNLFIDEAVAFRIQENKVVTRALRMQSDFPEDAQWKERLRKQGLTITIQGQVATVGAPYDFWINGEFSHCGYETFTLLKGKKGWKIASLTFSVNKEGCN